MNKINTILLKFDCNNTIKVINRIKELKINLPSLCYNIGEHLFKLELKKTEDKEEYKKNFEIEEFYKKKLYYYKIKINNNKIKAHQLEELIKEQIKLQATVSRYCYEGVDTGIFFITTNQKIEGSKRNLKINSKSYRIECMNDTEIKNYKTIWRETGIKKQENLINLDGNKKITNHREIVEEDYRLLLKSKKKDVEKVIVKGSNEKKRTSN